MIYIVGLGPGDAGSVTPHALEAMRNCGRVLLRTEALDAGGYLGAAGIEYEALDGLYESAGDFDSLCAAIAGRVMDSAAECDTAYAVADLAEASVGELLRRLPGGKGAPKVKLVPGVSPCAAATAGLSGEYQIVDGAAWQSAHLNPRLPLVIRELDTRLLASELKVRLLERYPADARVRFFAGDAAWRGGYEITLEQLDRQARYDHTVSARLDALELDALSERVMASDDDVRFDFEHLVEIVRRLRAPDGCPWDREQTHESLRSTMIEECYEAIERIDRQDWAGLYDELGDVLLQVVMHAQIADEHGEFAIGDVTNAICRKMIFRHSHIFGDDTAADAREVLKLWEERKRREKGQRTVGETMDGVGRNLPALMRADKVQAKAARAGFDWDAPEDALVKVSEEAGEVAQALRDRTNVVEELGDLLFACVNVARLAGVDSEQALRAATDKFMDRFTRMERAILDDGKQLTSMTLEQMDEYWDRIKH